MWGMIRVDTSTTLRYLFKSYALRTAKPLWPPKKPDTLSQKSAAKVGSSSLEFKS